MSERSGGGAATGSKPGPMRCALAVAAVLAAVALLAAGCGGGASDPAGAGFAPTRATHSVTGQVFYDQNDNGALDGDERVRLPGVRVVAGSQTAASDGAGRFTLAGLPEGAASLGVQVDSLPPWFQPGRPAQVTLPLPANAEVALPVTLAIGRNLPNKHLAFGDSITAGVGSEGGRGWTAGLQRRLQEHWGDAEVVRDGVPGSRSIDGVARLPGALADHEPAFTLILYGTNDWNRCQYTAPEACFTVDALRDMIRAARGAGSLPVVGTVIPVNPLFTERGAAERNLWVQVANELIRPMVLQEGAVLAESQLAFGTDPAAWPALFFDHIHPVDEGYARVTEAFFQALTRPRGQR